MDSFTDELIRDLEESNELAKKSGVSKLSVLKEVVKDAADESIVLPVIVFVLGPLVFGFSTYTLINTSTHIPVVEGRIFQIFEVRGIAVEALSLNDPILSEVMDEIEASFLEIVELAEQNNLIYYSRKPSNRFFVVGEYWNVIHYYDNDRIDDFYRGRVLVSFLSPVTGLGGLGAIILLYKEYRSKYKEMVGL